MCVQYVCVYVYVCVQHVCLCLCMCVWTIKDIPYVKQERSDFITESRQYFISPGYDITIGPLDQIDYKTGERDGRGRI